jgi:leader peptidase (prepilin peptidase)/N-methyltransferase
MLPLVVMLSAFVGAVIGLTMMVCKGLDKNSPIPYGPYLSVAAFIALLWGDKINSVYIQFAGL